MEIVPTKLLATAIVFYVSAKSRQADTREHNRCCTVLLLLLYRLSTTAHLFSTVGRAGSNRIKCISAFTKGPFLY